MVAFKILAAFETGRVETTDINGFCSAIQDQLRDTQADGRRKFETGAAETCHQVEALGTGLADDGTLVRGDPIAPHMRGMQGTLFHAGNTHADPFYTTIHKVLCHVSMLGIRSFPHTAVIFKSDQLQTA